MKKSFFKDILSPVIVFIIFFTLCFLSVISLKFLPDIQLPVFPECSNTTGGFKINLISDGDYEYHIEISNSDTGEILLKSELDYQEQLYLTRVVTNRDPFQPDYKSMCKLELEDRDFGILIGKAFVSTDNGESFFNLIPSNYEISILASKYCTQHEVCQNTYVSRFKEVDFKDEYVEATFSVEKKDINLQTEEVFDSIVRHEYSVDSTWEFIGRAD